MLGFFCKGNGSFKEFTFCHLLHMVPVDVPFYALLHQMRLQLRFTVRCFKFCLNQKGSETLKMLLIFDTRRVQTELLRLLHGEKMVNMDVLWHKSTCDTEHCINSSRKRSLAVILGRERVHRRFYSGSSRGSTDSCLRLLEPTSNCVSWRATFTVRARMPSPDGSNLPTSACLL